MDPQHPVFVITGTGVPGQLAANVAYFSFWISGNAAVIRLPGWGLGDLDASYALIEEVLTNRIDPLGAPALVAGHSQGGYHALRFALEHPEYVHTAMRISTPLIGLNATVRAIRRRVNRRVVALPAGKVLARASAPVWDRAEDGVERWLKRLSPGLHSLAFLGEAVQDLRIRMEEAWPRDVRLVSVIGEADRLVGREDGRAWEPSIPDEAMHSKYFLGHSEVGLPPDVNFRWATRSGHLMEVFEIELHKLVVKYSRSHRPDVISPAAETVAAV